MTQVGATLAGYRLDHLLARGGMGVVYRATQLKLERTVALKVIAPEFAEDPEFRERFVHESRMAAAIDHPNVLPIHEADEHDGVLFIAMRYVAGSDLRKAITRNGQLPPSHAAHIVTQIAAALDAAHAVDLVHRDVKPANVLLTGPEGREHAYLTDFGLTKRSASEGGLTKTGDWVGTLDYVAPEQLRGDQVDARADVYALGCVLFQMVSGQVPFVRESDVAKLYAHLSDPPPSLTTLVPEVPEALDEVVRRAMAKSADDRYPSAGDLARAALAGAEGGSVSEAESSVATNVPTPREETPVRTAGRARLRTRHPPLGAQVDRELGARLRGKYRTPLSVGVTLALLMAVVVAAVVVLDDGGGDDSVLARKTLAGFQSQVGQICEERNKINRSTARRAVPYSKRLKRAKDLQALRDVIIEEVQHRIDTSNDLRARLAGLDPPSQLGATQRKTLRGWEQSISRYQSYRDRLKRIRDYAELKRVVTRFDLGERTALEDAGAKTTAGLQRLGGQECKLETPPTLKPAPLPADPARPARKTDEPRPDATPSPAPSTETSPSPSTETSPTPDTSPRSRP